jgi:hypothetical protein
MTISDFEAHSRAVSSLQALLSKHSPGSSSYRIAERALDLAFNGMLSRGVASEQDLLTEAEDVLERQVQAKLLVEPVAVPTSSASSKRESIRRRYLAWRGPLRHHAAKRFVQAKLWLTTEELCGDGHAQVC